MAKLRQSILNIAPPSYRKVIICQLCVTLFFVLVLALTSVWGMISGALGGLIATLSYGLYSLRALKNFGHLNVAVVISDAYSAMWLKWAVLVFVSLLVVVGIEQISAVVLYGVMFSVHLVGVILSPLLVKREA